MNYVLAFALLLAYFAMHSLLANDKVKNWFAARTGGRFRFYRLMYNLVATVLLFLLLAWMGRWPEVVLFESNLWTNTVALILLALGGGISLAAFRNYDMGEFTGFQQLQQNNPAPNHSQLNTSGLNAVVRHPLYLGAILLLLGLFVFYPYMSSLLLLLSVLVYLPFGIYFEEKKLRRQFGQVYVHYQERVKCLIPFLV
ncbi:MAG: DUF1295 domain-containing protein [Saprospiraceae bacterium]|nr:DUF1295 domain-containing protein [Saprospiraceae bacterium]